MSFIPFIPRIRILDSVTNTYANLEMKDYVKYLGLMIDSNLSWKYHIESICHKISKSIGIIAKIRHYVPRRVLLSVYNSLIVPYLTYGICSWGNCALTLQRKIVTLQKRALRLIYFSKSNEHAVTFLRGALGYIRNRKTEEKNHPKPQNRIQNRQKPIQW